MALTHPPPKRKMRAVPGGERQFAGSLSNAKLDLGPIRLWVALTNAGTTKEAFGRSAEKRVTHGRRANLRKPSSVTIGPTACRAVAQESEGDIVVHSCFERHAMVHGREIDRPFCRLESSPVVRGEAAGFGDLDIAGRSIPLHNNVEFHNTLRTDRPAYP